MVFYYLDFIFRTILTKGRADGKGKKAPVFGRRTIRGDPRKERVVSPVYFGYIRPAVFVLYSLALGLAFFLIIPVYFVRLRLMKGESLHLAERLGLRIRRRETDHPCLWIHAVSVGEVLSLQHLVHSLKSKHPGWDVAFSVLTNSGFAMASAKLRDVDHLFFVPFDFAGPVRRVLRNVRPGLLVLVESEFWPRLLHEARRAGVPVLLVNGRVSERTGRRLGRFRRAARWLLKNINAFYVQTTRDRDRLLAAGIAEGKVSVGGNLKCETRLPGYGPDALRVFKSELSMAGRGKIAVAGSIHKGEEGLLVEAFRKARARRSDLLMVLAPRHPDKFDEIDALDPEATFLIRRRSALKPGQTWDILVVDTIGELPLFYALGDIAFIGGSLIPWGGQNLLEPAFYGKPVFFGPHMDNFADLAEALVRGGGAKVVRNGQDLADMLLMGDEDELRRMGERARDILTSLQGATNITLRAIEGFLGHDRTS
jgi:3-deoxy-D-manno-octulosonic-acid transferase